MYAGPTRFRVGPYAGAMLNRAGLAGVVLVVFLAAGCGSSKRTSHTTAPLPGTDALAYSRCMRANGVRNYPDPSADGNISKGDAHTFAVSDSQFELAERACRQRLPVGGTESLTQCLMTGACPAALVQRSLTQGLTFAQCMRSHGVSHWPDPTVDSSGRPSFQVTKAGISIDATRSPQMLAKIGDCQRQPGAVLLRQE